MLHEGIAAPNDHCNETAFVSTISVVVPSLLCPSALLYRSHTSTLTRWTRSHFSPWWCSTTCDCSHSQIWTKCASWLKKSKRSPAVSPVLATLNSPDTVDRVCFFRHVCGLVARFRVPGHTECYRLSNHCDHVSVFREPHVAASSLTAELLFRCQNGGRITLSPSSLRSYCDMDLSRWSHNLKWQHHDAQKKYDGMNRCTCLYRYTHLPARMCMQCIMNVFIALWT